MQIIYTPDAQDDLKYWVKMGNKPILKKILQLTNAIIESHFEGIGKPEMLKYDFTGLWSRRINREHRYVYSIDDEVLSIHSLKGHYE